MENDGLDLADGPRSVPEARRWAAEACRRLGREDLLDTAELAVSELVTNAVVHGAPPARLMLAGDAAHPRFEVADASPVVPLWPRPVAANEELASSGRGLDLVARASAAWGVRSSADGKVMWCEPATELSEQGASFVIESR